MGHPGGVLVSQGEGRAVSPDSPEKVLFVSPRRFSFFCAKLRLALLFVCYVYVLHWYYASTPRGFRFQRTMAYFAFTGATRLRGLHSLF